MVDLMPHQLEAIDKLSSGKILWGGTGSGKGHAVLGYYMKHEAPKHIYVITTAKKRDSLDWTREAASFGIGHEDYATLAGILTVDSWNNVGNYTDIEDAFFIFDEQRVVGKGAWVKSFLKIAKKNNWILLSATPGDSWWDYFPVFKANGFYKTKREFEWEHVVYEPFTKYPKVRTWLNEQKLEMLRNDILVEMPYDKGTERILNWIDVDFDKDLQLRIYKDRWNVYENRPLKDVSEMWRVMRRAVNSHPSRIEFIWKLMKSHPRLIIFYNFDYELKILRTLGEGYGPEIYEWNGHKKDPLPTSERWIYLNQYVAGAEGWNCTTTDAMVLYSLTYSYKNFEQVQGRIDRLNTPFKELYYYILVSNSIIDRGIRQSLDEKHNFNERKFMLEFDKFDVVSGEYLEVCEI